ncbi:5'-nucleotidase [Comamonas serinivorans]|uniref:5'-nucleotidase n=1 Tax=Comamonas serinivorans TaxID=1082851 RepID=A0A1Y0EMA5_9BURK|nr:5'-nucleotidase [Comamonas serinivorans]ARU04459.1 5'-nucleotidase [Comamonas serinivorans]
MAATLEGQLVVAISSRALFDFEEENTLFEQGDADAYMQLQLQRLNVPARPGVAFSLVRKLLAFNQPGQQRVEVVMLSRNDPTSGLRVFRSAAALGLASIQRGVFTQGADPFGYLRPLGAHLFLSANGADVREALALGYPAAQVATHAMRASDAHPNEVRIAFDGDAVLFSDEAERVYQADGLDAFQLHERTKAELPLPPGPFKPFLAALQQLQDRRPPRLPGQARGLQAPEPAHGERPPLAVADAEPQATPMRIRTALVTARSAPAHERAIRTLMSWNIAVDEAMFLGGLPKGAFLREFQPDFFFDDQTGHVDSAASYVPAGHVASGVRN